MNELELITAERRQVLSNIESALAAKNTFMKAEIGDPCISEEDRERVILRFDNKRTSKAAKLKSFAARKLAERITASVNKKTAIIGLENALSVTGGAIVTSNHYAPTDSTPIRMMAKICGKGKKLHIIVQESNIFMGGLFGFLMKNCNTHPVSKNPEYTVKNLKPCIEGILKEDSFLLIYPEQEMWHNYRKPRDSRDGAYYWAAYYSVPVIPTFTVMKTLDGKRNSDGFLPIKHILHIGKPIYPNPNLSLHENRDLMQKLDGEFKKSVYEKAYGIKLDSSFIAERDIAGIKSD